MEEGPLVRMSSLGRPGPLFPPEVYQQVLSTRFLRDPAPEAKRGTRADTCHAQGQEVPQTEFVAHKLEKNASGKEKLVQEAGREERKVRPPLIKGDVGGARTPGVLREAQGCGPVWLQPVRGPCECGGAPFTVQPTGSTPAERVAHGGVAGGVWWALLESHKPSHPFSPVRSSHLSEKVLLCSLGEGWGEQGGGPRAQLQLLLHVSSCGLSGGLRSGAFSGQPLPGTLSPRSLSHSAPKSPTCTHAARARVLPSFQAAASCLACLAHCP